MVRSSETVELTIDEIIQETDIAIYVAIEGEECWLPKSEIDYSGNVGDKNVEVEMPQWLAEKKELV